MGRGRVQYRKAVPGDDILSNTQDILLRRTLDLASVSDCKQRHGAILSRSGRILSIGVNVRRNDPRPWMPYDALSDHAEYSCLSGIPKPWASRGTLFVARLTPAGKIGYSEPCDKCKHYIETWTGIKLVIHT